MTSNQPLLGVNIDHIATLRQARGGQRRLHGLRIKIKRGPTWGLPNPAG